MALNKLKQQYTDPLQVDSLNVNETLTIGKNISLKGSVKGQILAATNSDTMGFVEVGADGTTLVANSASATGMAWAGPIYTAGKNVIINGNFDYWQRGTTFTNSGAGLYTADRFTSTINATGTNLTVTQDSSVPNAQSFYSTKFTQTTSASSVFEYASRHWVEGGNFAILAGKTVTLSFWYKSNRTGIHNARIYSGYLSGNGGDFRGSFNINVANTWQYITLSTSIPFGSITSISGSLTGAGGFVDIGFKTAPVIAETISLSAGDYFQISQVQLEAGSVATPFSRAGGILQGELAACQRYYYRQGGLNYYLFANGATNSTTTKAIFRMQFPVPMRIIPVAIDYSGPLQIDPGGGGGVAVSTLTQGTFDSNNYAASVEANGTGFTANRPYNLAALNSTTAYIAFSAEF